MAENATPVLTGPGISRDFPMAPMVPRPPQAPPFATHMPAYPGLAPDGEVIADLCRHLAEKMGEVTRLTQEVRAQPWFL